MTGKAAFKLKLPGSAPLLGLRKLTFNNMLQDPSATHEAMSYRLFRSLGVSAPRVGYAQIHVNGSSYGVYPNVETLDRIALERWFGVGNTTHLYEGSFDAGRDVTPEWLPLYEVDEGDGTDRSDLAALAAPTQAFLDGTMDGAEWFAAVDDLVDVRALTRHWAADMAWGSGYIGTDVPSYDTRASSGALVLACRASATCWAHYAAAVAAVRAAFLAGDYPEMQRRIIAAVDPVYRDPSDRNENPDRVEWSREQDRVYMTTRENEDAEADFVEPFLPKSTGLVVERRGESVTFRWGVYSPPVFPVARQYSPSSDGGPAERRGRPPSGARLHLPWCGRSRRVPPTRAGPGCRTRPGPGHGRRCRSRWWWVLRQRHPSCGSWPQRARTPWVPRPAVCTSRWCTVRRTGATSWRRGWCAATSTIPVSCVPDGSGRRNSG